MEENNKFRNNRLNITYTQKNFKWKQQPKKDKKIFLNIFWYAFLSLSVIWVIIWIVIYNKYLSDLPSIKDLENLDIAKSTTIYDRNWGELYKIFKENRTYIPYGLINKNMVNALVSWEDKTFFTNPWVDLKWMIRAVVNYWLWKTDKVEWTSTLTQQLIRNTVITNEKSLERKVKEMYLSYKVSQWLSKEKILELYLNKISFWNNAYWIEQASKTYFWKSAKDLAILESSILASIPKWPTYYSPYNHPDRLLWYSYIHWKEEVKSENADEDKSIVKILTKEEFNKNIDSIKKLTDFLTKIKAKRVDNSNIMLCSLKKWDFKNNINIDSDWCAVFDYSNLLAFLNNIRIDLWDDLYIEYQTWRKDFILWRMLEDWYIEFDNYIKSIIWSLAYEFKRSNEKIKYPHFVFYVKEYLEDKYGKEVIEKWWLEIYTSIDPILQDKAEELIKKATWINAKKYWASNSALISIDNKTWEILSMVWWKDFNSGWDWNVNIITSKLQPWSSFKPFVYSLAILKNPIWTRTPIFDLKTKFPWWYDPKNFDWTFMWKMNVSTALNWSRNIPAIKMYYLAWGQNEIVPFMNKLWVKSLTNDKNYWAPLALWAWEMTPLELASAYSVFANLWEKKQITPILKILDSKWKIIEESKNNKSDYSIDKVQAYLINHILTDTSTRPSWWNPFLTLKWRIVAAKTWTSTKESSWKWKKIFPANLWTIWYTPQITTVVWSWNTDWKEVKMNWDWLNVSWPIWRDFMEFAHKWKTALKWKEPPWVKTLTISSLSGFPITSNSNPNFKDVSLFRNMPKKKDWWLTNQKIDALCNWKISDKTPESAIKIVTLLEVHSLKPDDPNWEGPVQEWLKKSWLFWDDENLVTFISDKECDRWDWTSNIEVSSTITSESNFSVWNNYIEVNYKSGNPIQKLIIMIDKEKIQEIKVNDQKSWSFKWKINIPDSFFWKQSLTIQAIDNMYYSWQETKEITIWEKIKVPPKINITNPSDLNIKIYDDQSFNLRWKIDSTASMRSVNIYLDSKPLKLWIQDRDFSYSIQWAGIEPWRYILKVEAIDLDLNTWTQNIDFEVLAR